MIRRRLTTVGKVFLALSALFYLASITSQSGLLLLFIGLIGGCLLVNWMLCKRIAGKILLDAPLETFVSEGGAGDQPWRISAAPCRSTRPLEQLEVHSPAGLLFKIATISPGETVHAVPRLVYARRGVYPHSDLRIVSAAPFGLVQAERRLDVPGEAVVYPAIYDAPVLVSSAAEPVSGGKLKGRRRVTNGTEFAGVRRWESGDPMKQIDWKSSAKRDVLMVRTFDEELSGRIAFILDCRPGDGELEDHAVRAAGSLIFAALDAGHHADLFDAATGAHRAFPPFAAATEVLEILARYRGGEPKPGAFNVIASRLPRRAAVALVAPCLRPEHQPFLDEAHGQNRHATLCLSATAQVPVALVVEVLRFSASEIISIPAESRPFAPA